MAPGASSSRRARLHLLVCTLFLAGIGALLFYFQTKQLELDWNQTQLIRREHARVEALRVRDPELIKYQTECPMQSYLPVRIHVSGEPKSFQRYPQVDLRILAGGANQQRNHSFYSSFLISAFNNIYENNQRINNNFPRIDGRNYSDVIFRSSVCEDRREVLAGTVRRAVESAGFTFKAIGYCGGAGYENRPSSPQRGDWVACDECLHSKVMLAFERFTPEHSYLGEKLFLPLTYGAIPAYWGNGHEWMNLLSVNRAAFLDRNSFSSNEEFAQAIVQLLKDPARMQQMQREPVFLNPQMAYKRINFYNETIAINEIGPSGIPEIYQFVRTERKFAHLLNRPRLNVWQPRVTGKDYFIKILFNVSEVVPMNNHCADLEFDWCCP